MSEIANPDVDRVARVMWINMILRDGFPSPHPTWDEMKDGNRTKELVRDDARAAIGAIASASGVDGILAQRGAVYGNFMRQAGIACELKAIMRNNCAFDDLAYDQREALEMIAVKIARIINGDPNHADSWQDIAGYSQLVAHRLKGDE